ncbi:MAG TPA: ABC transporter permease [Bryobacteraceae bacterium]|nr:ABC transporter permease [Bryobacteraceae bacterium]
MTRIVDDLRHGWRMLRKTPVFTCVAVLTLALGIGANSAIFTLINAALLRPLPFPEPERLVLVWEDTSMFGLKDSPVAMGNYMEWRAQNRVFEEMGALERRSFRLTGRGEAQQIAGSVVTASLLRTLGTQPVLGRLFREDEDRPGTPKTVLLSDGFWRREFGGDPGILGRTARINDEPYTVAGVMPSGIRFPDNLNEIWVPAGASYDPRDFSDKGRHNAMVVARLKPGVSLARANEDIGAIARSLERQFPDSNAKVGAFVAPLREHLVADLRSILMVLAGAVGFVLLIACANIANLLLSRASNRRREMAIRAAIGASRSRIVRQLLTENLLLSGGGALCGLAIAVWGVKILATTLPAGISGISAVTVDGRVLAFTLAVSLLTGLLFGLAPAFELTRVDLHHTLKQGGAKQASAAGSRRIERVLVVSEVALAFMLAVGAALLMQSFAQLRGTDPGFQTTGILTMKTPLSRAQYRDQAKRSDFHRQVLERVGALPGVVSAGFTNGIPLVTKGDVHGFNIEGRPRLSGGVYSNANYRVVTPNYLATIGIPLREGRYLDTHDTPEAPLVALVNEALQRKFWAGEGALGKRFRFGSTSRWITIVGVVRDVKQAGLDQPSRPEMYLAAAQSPTWLGELAIRTKGNPKSLAAAVRREIRAVDQDVPVTDVRTMEEVLDREVFQRRAQMLLLAVFAALALLLASLGIYGVLAYLVARRTKEIGIRIALGASPRDVLVLVAGQGVGLSMAGIAAGAAGALVLAQVMSKLLFGIAATDGPTFVGVGVLLVAVASAASLIPARRAMRLDPNVALREE